VVTDADEALREPPSMEALEKLCRELAPGSHPEAVRRLGGGLDASMHAIDLVQNSGTRLELVVRRYLPERLARDPSVVTRTWQTLQTLQQLDLSAPRPVRLDADGALLGAPALVMTRLAGTGSLRPDDERAWLGQLAAGLAVIHRASIGGRDLGFLPQPGQTLQALLDWMRSKPERVGSHPDGAAVRTAFERWAPRLRPMTPVLVHGDYWAGNTLWHADRLTAVVDWDDARVDYPGVDVGYCRTDLAMLLGGDAPRIFLEAYEAAAGRRVAQLVLWDLAGVLAAMPDPERWLPGYHDLGRAEITPPTMRERLRVFIADVLARAG
jgi:aminoglycoside phosphotransferase (APT) family kinase protein